MLDERGDVFRPLAKRRHADARDVEAVQQVLAKASLQDHGLQVAVGGRDHPDIGDGRRAVRPDPLHFAGLEKTQQQRLHPGAHLPDLVEEDGPAVGLLQNADFVANCAGEAAPEVPKQLGLEQRLGQACAVQHHEGVVGPRRLQVHVPGDDILAGTGLTRDQDLGVTARNLAGEVQHLSPRVASADHRLSAAPEAPPPARCLPIASNRTASARPEQLLRRSV